MMASVRFLHRYAYIGIAGKNLDPNLLPTPKALIDEKEKAAFALRISPDRLQPGIKNALFDALNKLEEQLKTAEKVPPSVRELGFSGIKLLGNWSKAVLDDSKMVTIRFLNESKGMMQTFEIELEPKPRSTLALLTRSMKKTTNRFASLANNDNNVQHFFMKWPLFGDDLKDCTLKLLKVAQEEGLPLAPPDASAMLTELVNLGKRTVETGNLDLAFVIRGPNKDKLFSAILAISAKGPEEFEKALKVFIASLPEKDRERVKLDVAKIDDVGVHEIDVSDVPGAEQFEKVIGKEMKIRFAFGKDAACAADWAGWHGPDQGSSQRQSRPRDGYGGGFGWQAQCRDREALRTTAWPAAEPVTRSDGPNLCTGREIDDAEVGRPGRRDVEDPVGIPRDDGGGNVLWHSAILRRRKRGHRASGGPRSAG